MGLQDALRKAAGLIIEFQPAEPEERLEDVETGALASSGGDEDVDGKIQALLAQTASPPARTSGNAEETGETKTVEQIVQESQGPNLDQIEVSAPVAPAGAGVESAAIYVAAKLPEVAFSAEQMLEMLHSLPQELPLDIKRQTVKVTLGALGKSMGATPETIVADASRKIAALAAYEGHLSKRTQEFVATTEAEIATLEAQVQEKRKAILDARQNLTQSTQMCETESDRLDDVLEFFSLDVPPSRYAATQDGEPHK